MKSDVATDIYQTCLMMRRRIARIVQAKSFQNYDIEAVSEMLEVIDFIDNKLESYKKKYLKLKEKKQNDKSRKMRKVPEGYIEPARP